MLQLLPSNRISSLEIFEQLILTGQYDLSNNNEKKYDLLLEIIEHNSKPLDFLMQTKKVVV